MTDVVDTTYACGPAGGASVVAHRIGGPPSRDRGRSGSDHRAGAGIVVASAVNPPQLGPDKALYGISVAAELTGVNPQMLRSYEAKGLLLPYRTQGGTRRYSGHDLDRIHQISTLLSAGLNLTGIARVLQLEAETSRLQNEIDTLRGDQDDS